MTSERTSPPSGPVASQLSSRSASESAPSAASAGDAVEAHDTSRARSRNAEENLWSKRFFIFNTTVFKFYEQRRRGAPRTARLLSLSTATLQSPAHTRDGRT